MIDIAPADWGWSIWPSRKKAGHFDVLPDTDTAMHSEGPTCWCKPEEDEGQANVWIHNAHDKREAYFEGRRRLN